MTTPNPTGNQALRDGTDARIEQALALAIGTEGQTPRDAVNDLHAAINLLIEVVAENGRAIEELWR